MNGNVFDADLDPIVKDCRLLLGNFKNASMMYLNRTFNSDARLLGWCW